MARSSTITKLAQVAEDQWGLITRRQAEAAGVSAATLKRLIREEALERVASAVYHLAGAPIPEHMACAPPGFSWRPRSPLGSGPPTRALCPTGRRPPSTA